MNKFTKEMVDDYADKLGCLYDDSGCFITDIRIYCEEDHAEDETRECLLKYLNNKKN